MTGHNLIEYGGSRGIRDEHVKFRMQNPNAPVPVPMELSFRELIVSEVAAIAEKLVTIPSHIWHEVQSLVTRINPPSKLPTEGKI